MSVNKVIILGRVGQEPKVKEFDNGNKIVSFTIATSEKYTNKDGQKVENTEWHNISVGGKVADIAAKYVVKGMQLYVEGKIKTKSWEKDGVKHYQTEIAVDNLQFIESKKSESDKNDLNVPPPPQPIVSDNSDDLPF